jgi:hypothetical protein
LEVVEMWRKRIGYLSGLTAFASAAVVFPTGLALLLWFHIGPHGAERAFGLGLSRIAWVSLHQFSAVAMTAAMIVHIQLHWEIILMRVQRAFHLLPGKAPLSDLTLYFAFAVSTTAAFAAWLAVPESLHHPAIDIHYLSALALLTPAVTHVRRHYRRLIR